MDMFLYELGSIALVIVGFLIREAMERWKDYHVALALHKDRVNQQQREAGIRRRRVYTMKKYHGLTTRLPVPDIKEQLTLFKKARAVRINGEWKKGAA